jgi:hypothetical protein
MLLSSNAGHPRAGKSGPVKAVAALSLALIGSWLVAACGTTGPGGASPGGGDPQEASYVIGAEGGIVLTEDGSSISVPRGALTHDVTISIASDPSAPALADGTPVGMYYLLGPEGQQFDVPVTVTIAFDPSLLPAGETASDIVVFTAPKTSSDYEELATTVVDSLHVSVQTTHFSHVVAASPHYTKMFGLGVDAPLAMSSPTYGELKQRWTTGEFSVKSARIVFNIDAVDGNPDGACTTKPVKTCTTDLVASNRLDPEAWAVADASGLSSLGSWIGSVKGAGLVPLVAIDVHRFSDGKHASSLSTGEFRGRFGYLLSSFPEVAAWGLINEPNDNGFEAGTGGIAQAVEYYVAGAEVLHDLQAKGHSNGVKLWAGEFAVGGKQSYWSDYLGEMLKQVHEAPKKDHVGFPHVWGLHPYGDTTDGNTDETGAYTKFLGDFEKEHHWKDRTLRVWLTETGTMLEWGIGKDGKADCADSGAKYKTNADAARAQFHGAQAVYEFTKYSRVDRVYWWQFEEGACDWGGAWDSGMVDWNGAPRPAYCALTRQGDDLTTCNGMSYSRDCGGVGKDHCGGSTAPPPPSPSSGGGGGSTCTPSASGCYKDSGGGTTATCESNWSTFSGFTCGDAPPGFSSGSCSTAGLYGCCITKTVGGGVTTTTATCYYDASVGAGAEGSCSGGTGGTTHAWSSCPP